jgi:hypothetical protein
MTRREIARTGMNPMPTTTPLLPPMPDAGIPLVLPDGRMNPDWYRWLKAVVEILKTLRTEIP